MLVRHDQSFIWSNTMKINKETWFIVYKNWDIFLPCREKHTKEGYVSWILKERKLKVNKGEIYRKKEWKRYSPWRIVYCTYNDLPLNWKFRLWHYNNDLSDNRLENLFIKWKNKKNKRNKKPYNYEKLWDIIKKNKFYNVLQ